MFYPIFQLLLKPLKADRPCYLSAHYGSRKCLFKTLTKKHISTYKVIDKVLLNLEPMPLMIQWRQKCINTHCISPPSTLGKSQLYWTVPRWPTVGDFQKRKWRKWNPCLRYFLFFWPLFHTGPCTFRYVFLSLEILLRLFSLQNCGGLYRQCIFEIYSVLT